MKEAINSPTLKNYVWGRLYHKDIVYKIQFSEGLSLGEDTVFNLSAMCMNKGIKILEISAPLYYYFQRSNSLVHTYGSEELLHKVDAFCSCLLGTYIAEEYQIIFVEEAIKGLLAYRYMAMFEQNQKIITDIFKKRYKGIKKMFGYQKLPTSKKVIYSILRLCPWLYRNFRIRKDKTLLIWELAQRKKMTKSKNAIQGTHGD